MPIAGAFIKREEFGLDHSYPLTVVFCRNCKEVQILEVIDAEAYYKDYRFLASTTKTHTEHFKEYAREMKERFLKKDALVVEFGSNDGILLKPFQELGVKAIGVEPATNVANIAISKGCEVINDFFNQKIAGRIEDEHGKADFICGNNVFAHMDDIQEVMKTIVQLLKNDGVFVFEVHYLLDLIEQYQYDMIYHDHMMYHSLAALSYLMKLYNMEIFDVKRIPIHCGSIRVYAQMVGGPYAIDSGVSGLKTLEKERELDKEKTFLDFGKEVYRKRDKIRSFIQNLKKEGKRIIGYGASGRATIHLNFCDFGPGIIEYIIDASPERYGRFVPGTRNPIYSPEILQEDKPDYALLFAYNYLSEIINKEKTFLERGGKFIVPVPEPKII